MSRKSRILAINKEKTNRLNAQHSTGPKTETGKAASSQNSFRHGLTSTAITMLAGEDPQDFMDFGTGMRAEHKPATVTEDALVSKMIESLWLSARALRLQQGLMLEPPYRRADLDLYMRYQTMHDRAFSRALTDLAKLRKASRDQQTGFVSQDHKQQLHEAKIRNLNARSAATESATQARKVRATTPPPAVAIATPGPIPNQTKEL